MKLEFIGKAKNYICNKSSRAVLTCKKNSPAILLGVGCVGVAVGTVMACKETLKLDDILVESKEKLDKIKDARNNPKFEDRYSEDDANHDTFVVYSKTAVKVVKNYIPSIGIMALSIACILASYKIMKKRNVALTAAYNGLKLSFDQYRKRVKEKYGEDEDKNLFFGVDEIKSKLDQLEKDKAEGKFDKGNNSDCNGKKAPWYSDYAKFFDASSPFWDKSPSYNKAFLLHKQSIWNEKLNRKGHVFLNEVYDDLGIPRTQAGSVVGWIKGGKGDGYIDFGIWNGDSDAARRFVNELENVFLLDFNVDGVIYDKIGEKV